MLEAAERADVVLMGECHDDPIAHVLEVRSEHFQLTLHAHMTRSTLHAHMLALQAHISCSAGWLVDWLSGSPAGWQSGWLAVRLSGCPAGWLSGWLAGWLFEWPA